MSKKNGGNWRTWWFVRVASFLGEASLQKDILSTEHKSGFGGTRKGCFVSGSAEDCLPSDGCGATACDGGLRIDDFLTGGMPGAFGAPCPLTIECLAIGCLAIACLAFGAPCSLTRFARGGGGW